MGELLDEIRRGQQVTEARDIYSEAIEEFDVRETERSAIRVKLEEVAK